MKSPRPAEVAAVLIPPWGLLVALQHLVPPLPDVGKELRLDQEELWGFLVAMEFMEGFSHCRAGSFISLKLPSPPSTLPWDE